MFDDDADHPLLTYGFGIDLWRKQLKYQLLTFFLLACMAYGLMRIYQSQGKISGGKFDWMARASLGNFQGA